MHKQANKMSKLLIAKCIVFTSCFLQLLMFANKIQSHCSFSTLVSELPKGLMRLNSESNTSSDWPHYSHDWFCALLKAAELCNSWATSPNGNLDASSNSIFFGLVFIL